MPGGAIAGAGIASSIVGGIIGRAAGSGDAGQARDAANLALSTLQQIGLPPDEARPIVYQQFQQKGLMTPELEQHINQQASLMGQVQGSPEAQKAQMQALQILQQRGQTGLTPEDRSALNQIRQQIASDTEAKRQQILQNFAARGEAGGGNELIAALQASQSGANAESQAGDRLAAMASQNALQAIGQAGTLGGQIQQQQFGEQAQKAQAQDIINQFNTQNAINQQARNVAAQNQAQQYNLGVGQQLANANVQQANQELLRQNQAARQQWLDTMAQKQAIAGGYMGQSNYLQNASQREASQAAAPWEAIGAAGTTIGGQMLAKPNYTFNLGSPSPTSNSSQVGASGGGLGGYGQTGAGITQVAWKGGKIPNYDEGGEVDKSLADKISDYFANKPVETQVVDPNKAQSISDSFKAATYAQGGNVQNPQLMKLRKIFPKISEDSLRAIHAQTSNPLPSLNPPRLNEGGDIGNHYKHSQYTDYRTGGNVPGKANVQGDSPQNDTVKAMLSPGEYVIPRSQTKSPFGKKLIKLLEAHHEVMKHDKDNE